MILLRIFAIFAFISAISLATHGGTCDVECSENQLKVCIRTSPGDCKCRCSKNVDDGGQKLKNIMEELGASETAIQQAQDDYWRYVDGASTTQSFRVEAGNEAYEITVYLPSAQNP